MGQLAPADIAAKIPSGVRLVCRELARAGFRSWVVGGCTRDLLLGRPVHDWDVATDARPDDVLRAFRRVVPTGIKHGTVTVLVGTEAFEVTTLRGEGAYSDGRHPDRVEFVRDLSEDLARRDFTMNAIAIDPATGAISDPFGGCRDLRARTIRAVGEPAARFNEDGLRVMRAVRFAATLEFELEERTREAIPAALGTLRKVSAERVRDEILKALAAPRPSRSLELMRSCAILPVVLPELVPLVGLEQNRYHAFDVWTHTMRALDACPADVQLRLAVLLHDVGKPAVRAMGDKTADYTFYQHEAAGARLADAIALRLRLSNDDRTRLVGRVRNHLVVYGDDWTDAAVRRWVRRVGPEEVEPMLAIARADAAGKGSDPSAELERIERLRTRAEALARAGLALSARDLAVDGRELMRELGIAPGPLVGKILAGLLEAVIEEPEANEPGRLLARARELMKELCDSPGRAK